MNYDYPTENKHPDYMNKFLCIMIDNEGPQLYARLNTSYSRKLISLEKAKLLFGETALNYWANSKNKLMVECINCLTYGDNYSFVSDENDSDSQSDSGYESS
ncbi:MAG: hypothetical protein AABY22_04305 [Nanoarchaeota archaeon]